MANCYRHCLLNLDLSAPKKFILLQPYPQSLPLHLFGLSQHLVHPLLTITLSILALLLDLPLASQQYLREFRRR